LDAESDSTNELDDDDVSDSANECDDSADVDHDSSSDGSDASSLSDNAMCWLKNQSPKK
jgi:hypothetical protein